MKEIIDRLLVTQRVSKEELKKLLVDINEEETKYLFDKAREVCSSVYHNKVYIRGLIEVSNYCKKDCYYCGIRKSNTKLKRYRLQEEALLECCKKGYELGIRTFVLQGGEDAFFSTTRLVGLIKEIKSLYSECAVTLSLGEMTKEAYEALYKAGADRYLLRHETYNEVHYSKLHPKSSQGAYRKQCLQYLKEIGFQVGCGFMVGSPYQTIDHIVEDLMYIKTFNPHMVGIGPFIPHRDTPFKDYSTGSYRLTLKCLAITRLLLPSVLLPATTALSTLHSEGKLEGVLCGANVIMPNISPKEVRPLYTLYDNKAGLQIESSEEMDKLKRAYEEIGYTIVVSRGDYLSGRK